MEGKMKKIFAIFMAGLPFMVEAMQSMSTEEGLLTYSTPLFFTAVNEISCYPPTTTDEYGWAHRAFAQHESPRSSVTINKIVFSVTSIVNPAYELPKSFPAHLWDYDDMRINTALEDTTLKSIRIPTSIQLFDAYCFYQCAALEEVKFEQNSQLQRIGKGAFFSCLSLKSITIPKSVQFLDERCFFYCKNLRELIFESGSNLERIGESAFDDCPALESIIVWDNMDITPLQNYFGTDLDRLIHVVND
jgi:hypothetical protein